MVLHAVAALAAPVLARALGRRVFLALAAVPAATVIVAASQARQVLDGQAVTESYPWAPGLGLAADLRLDAFALLMVALISGIGALIHLYAYGYFTKPRADLGRFAASLTAFAGAMLGLVLADDLLLVFAFWELTSITSYLLIGTDDHRSSARSAALQAFLTTGAGGLAMLGGFVMLTQAAGTNSLSAMLADPPSGTMVEVALVLVLLGAFTKSAQVPFHAWLPGAMAAPTPVSAYLHSATMVKAGVYLVARFSPAFAGVGVWTPLVVGVGLTTMLLGGWRALRQHDLKLILAYGTVSQLGFLMVLFGAGDPETILAGTAMLLAHGLFKAALFATVGIVDHAAHTRDVRRLSGVAKVLPITAVVGTLAVASMAGVPPLLGFVGKEAALASFGYGALGGAAPWVLTGLVAGSILTVAYSARFLWGAFASKSAADLREDAVEVDQLQRPARSFDAPGVVLAALGVALGIAPVVASVLVVPAARALDSGVPEDPLALWHGVNLALVLSVVVLTVGALLFVGRSRVERWQAKLPRIADAGAAYRGTVNGALAIADRVTGVVQNGSLPIYLAVILLTAVSLPVVALVGSEVTLGPVVLAERPGQVVVALVIVAAALATTVVHRRFAAVLTLGGVGFGIAVLFVLQGAPDLALTQLLVETLVLVLFVLVLRHLPEDFRPRRWGLGQGPRIVIAVIVGVAATVFTVVAVAARVEPSVSLAHLERALPDADGRNVVNTILVDFRGFDTFGEIVVLVVAALGVTSLVRAARRDRGAGSQPPKDDPNRSSLLLDTGVRAVFRTLVLFSLYLLVAGHNQPGGGFIGGLVAGAALVLVAVSRGPGALQRAVPVPAEALLGGGLLVAAASAGASWLVGGPFLGHLSVEVPLPVLGSAYLSTTLTFDIGVFLVVVGLVLALLRSLGREEVRTP